MKTGKKTMLLAFMIISVMLITAAPMIASAAPALSIGDITHSASDGVISFTVPYTATEVEHVTVLAVIGDASGEPTTVDSTNICYINQQAAAGTSSFSFNVDAAKIVAPANVVYIKIGGTAIDTAQNGAPQEIGVTHPGSTVSGYVQTYTAGATITITGVGSTTTATDGQFTFTQVADGQYDLVITAKAALTRTIPVTVAGSDVEVSTSTNKIGLMYGDVNGSGKIDVTDISAVKNAFNKASADTGYVANADINDSGKIDVTDISGVKNAFNKAVADYTAWVK